METSIDPVEATAPKPEQLPALPFKYERTLEPDQAAYREWRVSPVSFAGVPNEPRTDQEIIEMIKREREGKDWFTSEYWRSKGLPEEQIEFQMNGQAITVYNWNKDKPFTDEHIQKAQRAFQELASRFPQITDQMRWILIDDKQEASAFGDPEKYPLNGFAMRGWEAFRLLPRGMELIPHRVAKASNFEGTFVHESTHLIQQQFEPEWSEKFKWDYCYDHEDEWEIRPTPDGTTQRWFNKQTGEMSPQGQFPLQPDQCVTYYAKQNMGEDICDSIVAYIYDPDLLQGVSPDKSGIFQKHDAKQPLPKTTSRRVAKEEIKLPEVKEETVHYYIQEPNTASKE